MSILFITRHRIGDAIISTGVLDGLADRFPGCGFTVVCGPEAVPLFVGFPALEQLIPLPKRPLHLHWPALWRKVASRRWEAVVDLRRTQIGRLLRAGLRHRPGANPGNIPEVAHLSRALGFPETRLPRLWLDRLAERRAADLLPAGAPILALGPGALWPGKRWPVARFAELARALTAAAGAPLPGARILLIGGADDRDLSRRFAATAGGDLPVVDMVGQADLSLSAALLRRATLFVGNDSAPMHLAAAAGVPTLGLFGPTSETIYGPAGVIAAAVRGPRSVAEIRGAPGFDPAGRDCHMTDLALADVVVAATALLARANSRLPPPEH